MDPTGMFLYLRELGWRKQFQDDGKQSYAGQDTGRGGDEEKMEGFMKAKNE
jgi:hypothetical protein